MFVPNLLALESLGVSYRTYEVWGGHCPNQPIKNRLIVGDQQLARWDENDYCEPTTLDERAVRLHGTSEPMVISDYGKGSITPELVYLLSSLGLPLFVDTKSDPLPWLGARDITLFPNLSEYHRYQASYDWFPKVLLKRSEEGLAWLEYGRVSVSRPALAQKVVSVNGAGDTVLAAWVYAQTQGMDLVPSMEFANTAAAVVVEKPFTSVVTLEEISARNKFSVGA